MKSTLALLCTCSFLLLLPNSVMAARSTACDVITEEIIPLRVPSFDVPILWKKTMGGVGPDIAVDVIPLADGGFVVIGETSAYDSSKGLGEKQLYMARLDINGKIVWEKRNPIKGFAHASAGVAVKDRLAVLNGIENTDKSKTIQIDFYDGLGALKSTTPFTDAAYNLIPEGLVADSKAQTMTIALWAVNKKDPDDNFTILKKVSFDGKELSNRQYLPGVPNHLESFLKTPEGNFIGSGQIENNGVKSGWVFYVDGEKGDLRFQRPYARGAQSNIRSIVPDGQGHFIAIGDSIPAGEGSRAAWIMKLDQSGNPIWQKYVQGRYAFSGRDVNVIKDGRILAMLNARPLPKEGGRDHVRLLTFSPNGQLLGDEALIEGSNAQGVTLFTRENSRIISGMAQIGLENYALAKDQKSAGFDFWVLGLPKLGAYNDLCGAGGARDSFDEGY